MARSLVAVMVGVLFCTAVPAGGASDPAPGIALKRTGTADCSTVMSGGSVLVLGVKVTGGHSICVTGLGEERSFYFDGRPGGGSSGDATSQFGGIGTVKRRYVLFGFLPPSADSLRLTFCGGQTMVLRPLNESQPRFVGAIVDAVKYGNWFPEPADAAGRPLEKSNARRTACRHTS
jgi:hypothetical protein